METHEERTADAVHDGLFRVARGRLAGAGYGLFVRSFRTGSCACRGTASAAWTLGRAFIRDGYARPPLQPCGGSGACAFRM